MNRWIYLELLKTNLRISAEKSHRGNCWIFQQNRDPKQTSAVVKEWLLYNAPKKFNTPSQSPDMNPVEHIWDYLEEKIRKYAATHKALLQEWTTGIDKNSNRFYRKTYEFDATTIKAVFQSQGESVNTM
ncbi:hypothetical protein Trydic_g905 [Trypoxylus dichotomus]